MRLISCAPIWMALATAALADPAPVRVAVVSDADDRSLAALVTTELSGNPDISLVERDDLAKVGDELKLQQLAGSDSIALGKSVGASGLFFIEKASNGFHVQFTAVSLGYELFDDELPTGDNPAELAKSLAHRVTGYASKLALDPGHAVSISVLNLRADLGAFLSESVGRVSPAGQRKEREDDVRNLRLRNAAPG